jgi:PAS domain S-box-containing protein
LNVRANEADRLSTEQSFRRYEKQFADIIETAADAIISVDAENKIVVFNHAAEALFHTLASTAIGSSLFEFLPEYEKSPRQSTELGQTVQMTGHRRTDGTFLSLEVSISFADESGKSQGTFVLRDVSTARAQEQLRGARHKAEAASQAKSQFIARMSHELRTPLNAVLGFAQLLQSTARSRLTPVELRQLDHIFVAGAQLRALVNDVLDVSKIEAGTLSIELEDIALNTLLDETLKTCEAQASAARIELKAAYRTHAGVVLHTDPLRLRQAILNLISNGIKYNMPGGFVSVDISRSPGHIDIRVDDSGLGMTRAQLSGIFQPFNRLGMESSNIEGTGIGLVICRQLVELLGGALTFESESGKGTQARLSLPYVEGGTATESTTAEFTAFSQRTAPFLLEENASSDVVGTVLYIEDNPVNALLVQQLVSCWPKLKLVIAEDGSDGLAQASQVKPDLILLDMFLPDMTGLDVLSRLKSDPATQDIRVVALSASALNEEVAAALKAGAVEYWLKPIDFQPFLDGLRTFLATEHA